MAQQLEAPIRIAAITEHPRVAGRYRVECHSAPADGDSRHPPVVVLLGVAAIAELGLRSGAVLAGPQVAQLVHEVAVLQVMDAAVRSLARGRRSERDLRVRLRRTAGDPSLVDAAIARLRAAGVVDDAAFAQAEAAARLRRGGEASGQVLRRLRQRGVAGAVAADAIAQAQAEQPADDVARCLAVAERRARQLQGYPPDVRRRRLVAFLQRRGFTGEQIRRAMRAVWSQHAMDGAAGADDGVDVMVGDE